MVIKVYVTSVSASSVIKKHQTEITDALEANGIPFQTIDISSPDNEEAKKFMRVNSKPEEGKPNPLPPQIFSDDEYLGDYNCFADSRENEELLVFFKIAAKQEVSQAEVKITGGQVQQQEDE